MILLAIKPNNRPLNVLRSNEYGLQLSGNTIHIMSVCCGLKETSKWMGRERKKMKFAHIANYEREWQNGFWYDKHKLMQMNGTRTKIMCNVWNGRRATGTRCSAYNGQLNCVNTGVACHFSSHRQFKVAFFSPSYFPYMIYCGAFDIACQLLILLQYYLVWCVCVCMCEYG